MLHAELAADLDLRRAYMAKQLDSSLPELRQALRDDKLQHIRSLTDTINRAADGNDHQLMYKALRALGKFNPTRPPMVRLASGQLATSTKQAANRWMEHLMEVHHGRVASAADIAKKAACTERTFNSIQREHTLAPSIHEVR